MFVYICISFICFLGAFMQSGIGFGAAVLMVNVLPFVLVPAKAIVVSQCTCVFLNSFILWKTRKHLRWDVLIPILIPSLVCALLATRFSLGIDVSLMKIILGGLFVLLAVYFSFIASKIRIRPTKKSAFVIGLVSGFMNGFFGSGGPPAVLYLTPALEKKEEYLATAQVLFLSTNIMSLAVRFSSGIVNGQDMPMIVTGIISGIVGAAIGMKCTKKLNGVLLKRFVYAFIGINGVIIILNQLL